VVRGGPVYACCSLSYADSTLEAGWDSADETDYVSGTTTGGATADDHDEYRRSDRLGHVFARYQVPEDWDWTAGNGEGTGSSTVAVYVTEDGFLDSSASVTPYWYGHVFERELPLTDDADGSADPDYRAPFVLVKDGDGNWHYSDKLDGEDESPFGFSISGRELALSVRPRINHIMAKNHFGAAADSNVTAAFDWQDAISTQMFSTDSYLWVRLITSIPEYGDSPRIKRLEVPEAVAWYVVPNTVVDCVEGALKRYGDTGYTAATNNLERDDSSRLRAIAALASVWYGRPHNTMQLVINDVSLAHPVGTMISESIGAFTAVPVRTVVSARHWDFRSTTTTVTTGWDELQITSLARGLI